MILDNYDFSNKSLFNFRKQQAFRLVYQSLRSKKASETLNKYFNVVTKKQSIAKTTVQKFNEQSGPSKITTLHLAVMTGQYETVKKLLTIMKVDPNSADWHGWTPLHHATVLQNARMINLLVKFGARCDLQNDQEGTPVDLHEMIHADSIPLKEKIYQVKDDGDFEEMSREDFEEISGAKYIDRMWVKPEIFLQIWTQATPSIPKGNFIKECRKQYYDLTRDVQTIALQVEGQDETGKKIPIGSSTVAMRDIKNNELICEYLGSYCPSEEILDHESDTYRMSRIDGISARNLGPIIPDGLPNAMTLPLLNTKGLPERSVLVASRDIPKGTPIAWDYGKSTIKIARLGATDAEKSSLSNRYIEVFPHTLDTFLQANDFKTILMNFHQFLLTRKPLYDYENLSNLSVILYVLNTPIVFIKHVLNGNLSKKDLALLFDKEFLRAVPLQRESQYYKRPNVFQVEALLAIMETPEKYTFLRNFLLTFLERGYLYFCASAIVTLSAAGIHRFQDVEGFSPEDFIHFKELAFEFLEEGKGMLASQVLLDLFKSFDPKYLANKKRFSKDFLKSYYIKSESEILKSQIITRDTDS